jgi:hypothetical protein
MAFATLLPAYRAASVDPIEASEPNRQIHLLSFLRNKQTPASADRENAQFVARYHGHSGCGSSEMSPYRQTKQNNKRYESLSLPGTTFF